MTPGQPSHSAAGDLHEQALDWFVRRQRPLSADEAQQFQAWLDADPAHAAALEQWGTDWNRLDALPATGIERLKRQLAADKARATPASPARRHWLAALAPKAGLAGLALSTSGGGWLAWQYFQSQPQYAENFATARGEQQEVTLPDGSLLRLDTDTRIAVTLYRERREVRLLDGQAVFHVHGDAARPFDVLAGTTRVTVVGTRFSVRHTPGIDGAAGVQVAVEEGRVRVTGDSRIELGAGQQLAVDSSGRLGRVERVADAGIAPWRDGRINFDDTPLARVLAEFERYGRTGLVVRAPDVAALGVTGTFDPRHPENFARVLPKVLPVELRRNGGATEIVARH